MIDYLQAPRNGVQRQIYVANPDGIAYGLIFLSPVTRVWSPIKTFPYSFLW